MIDNAYTNEMRQVRSCNVLDNFGRQCGYVITMRRDTATDRFAGQVRAARNGKEYGPAFSGRFDVATEAEALRFIEKKFAAGCKRYAKQFAQLPANSPGHVAMLAAGIK